MYLTSLNVTQFGYLQRILFDNDKADCSIYLTLMMVWLVILNISGNNEQFSLPSDPGSAT